MKRLFVALISIGCCCLPAAGSEVTYHVGFTGGSVMSTAVPSGSFAYDPSAGFSDFFVNWDGVTFDLTSAANAPGLATDPPTGCTSAASDHAYGFLLMSQTAAGCTVPAQYAWSGMYFGEAGAQFTFILNVTSGLSVAQDEISAMVFSAVPESPMMDFGGGGWEITEAGVPEPSTLAMGVAAALGLAGIRFAGRIRRRG